MAKPIFVIGLNRSGTKWLSNEIAKHPDIACVQNERTGIRETNMFRGFGRKFDLNNLDEYIALVELWSATDFFQRTGVDKSIFYTRQPLPSHPMEMFGILMDEYARKLGKSFWLQKAQPYAGIELIERFPDAHFITIRRKVVDQVRSVVKLKNRPSLSYVIRATLANVRDNRVLTIIEQNKACHTVDYDALLEDKEHQLATLLNSLSLAPISSSEFSRVEKIANSSFSDAAGKKNYFGAHRETLVRVISELGQWIPTRILTNHAKASWFRPGPLVPGSFAQIESQFPSIRDFFDSNRRRSYR